MKTVKLKNEYQDQSDHLDTKINLNHQNNIENEKEIQNFERDLNIEKNGDQLKLREQERGTNFPFNERKNDNNIIMKFENFESNLLISKN